MESSFFGPLATFLPTQGNLNLKHCKYLLLREKDLSILLHKTGPCSQWTERIIIYDLWPDQSGPVCWKVAVADPGGAASLLFLDQTEARRTEKNFVGRPHPAPYLNVCIWHCVVSAQFLLRDGLSLINDPELLPWWASLSLYSKSMHYEYQRCALVCLHECVLTPLRR